MDRTNAYPTLHLAAARLLDAIEARPRSRIEFDAAKAKSLQSARAALEYESPPRSGANHDWLPAATRLGRTLGARRKGQALRLAADFLRLPRMCERSECQRAQCCRCSARVCLKQSAPRVPATVRDALMALAARVERGDSPELAVALLPFECKAALWAWWRVAYKRRRPCLVIPE